MNAAQHTPGPWEKCDRGDYSDFDGHSNVILGDDTRICVVQNSGDDWADANARLIAAAPDMLAALLSAQESIASFMGVHGYPNDSGAGEILREVSAVIAKAKGETE